MDDLLCLRPQQCMLEPGSTLTAHYDHAGVGFFSDFEYPVYRQPDHQRRLGIFKCRMFGVLLSSLVYKFVQHVRRNIFHPPQLFSPTFYSVVAGRFTKIMDDMQHYHRSVHRFCQIGPTFERHCGVGGKIDRHTKR